jgi:hypothetical protein
VTALIDEMRLDQQPRPAVRHGADLQQMARSAGGRALLRERDPAKLARVRE